MIIINDVHIGTARAGGTTPTSALALRGFLLDEFARLLDSINQPLVILGDLFDTHTIPMQDMLDTYDVLRVWLNKGHMLYLVAGNHDLHTDSSKVSSFQVLSYVLSRDNPNVACIFEPTTFDGFHIIPHTLNQDLFDMYLEQVPEVDYLLVHCNYDNNFAKESDHSLNISKEQAQKLPVKHIIFAHEHHAKTALSGKVVIPGNQIPSSIVDCLGGSKNMLEVGFEIGYVPTWDKSDYEEQDWRSLSVSPARFVRVVGTCTEEEAADMANAVAKFRKVSEAFVIGNAVKVQGSTGVEELASLDAVKGFNVLDALKESLTKEEYEIVEKLNV